VAHQSQAAARPLSPKQRKYAKNGKPTARKIFESYAAGLSPKQIAKTLNSEGVRGPQGSLWNPSTIHGNPKRGIGMLNNELYIGRLSRSPHGQSRRSDRQNLTVRAMIRDDLQAILKSRRPEILLNLFR
jgi:hypothetical protein